VFAKTAHYKLCVSFFPNFFGIPLYNKTITVLTMERLTNVIFSIFGAIFVMLLFTGEAEAADLEPINFTMSPDYPVMGETIEIRFEVVNNEELSPATDVDIVVWNSTSECDSDDQCTPIFETTVAIIDHTKPAEIEFSCAPHGADGCGGTGDRVLTISVDYTEEISESNEDNNKIVHEFTIYSRAKPNLKGMDGDFSITFDTATPSRGDAVDIVALFQNTGREETKGDFYLHFTETVDGDTNTIELVEVRFEIAQGASIEFNVTWVPNSVGDYLIEVMLDSDDDLDEFEEDDNLLNTTIFVREHTPELTLDESRNITVTPVDTWLDEIYSNHAVTLTVQILNEDYAMPAENIKVSFWDLPEGEENPQLIGDYIVPYISNGTRVDNGEVNPGTQAAFVVWDVGTGTSTLGNHTIIVEIDSDNSIDELDEDDNDFSFELKVLKSKPDLTIFDINVIGDPVSGIPSDVVITVFNKGSKDVSNVDIEFRVDGTFVDSWVVTLSEGEFTNITGQYSWAEQRPSIAGYADNPGEVDELEETNNIKSKIIGVAAPHYDLILANVTASDEVFKGESVDFLVEVKNRLARIPEFRLSLYVDNSSNPEFQTYDFEGEPVYYVHQQDLLHEEVRFVTVSWKTASKPGLFNISIKIEIENSDIGDLNLSNNIYNTSILIKPKNFQLSVEMVKLPNQIYFNETLQIQVSAFNFGPEICCECPANLDNMTNATELCTGGAEIALYINGELLANYPDHIYLTKPLARAIGEEVHVFYWTPEKLGTYELEVRIDPDNIIDEYDELDNRAFGEVTVIVDDRVVIEPEVIDDDDSLINQPLVWIPLIILSVAGLGLFAYSRLGDGGDYFDDYSDMDDTQTSGIQTQQSGFRYNPETGETVDLKTGEIIGQDGKKNQ